MQDTATIFNYQSTFTLDKAHFVECYEESVDERPFSSLYLKAMVMLVVGASLVMFSDINAYAAWFIFSLGILEVVSTYYRKPWWVARQMLSKAAKSKVSVEVSNEYIRTFSFYADNTMKYEDISTIKATNKGWLISHKSGVHYISKSCLSDEASQYIQLKA